MKITKEICRVALVQAEPVLFDKVACEDKTIKYTEELAANKAELIVFPELFIPGYPTGMNFGFSMGKRIADGRVDWKRYYDASMCVGNKESIIYADLDMTLPEACKMEHDAVGHYARPDILELIVHE